MTRLFLAPSLLLLLLFVSLGISIKCYVCSPDDDNYCKPLELSGNLTECPPGVNVCYKSWSGE